MEKKIGQTLFFDLDGTIIDSSQGIMASLEHVIRQQKLPHLEKEMLRTFIGPPLVVSVQQIYGMTKKQALEFEQMYRVIYQEKHMDDVLVYPQIREVLTALSQTYSLAIATSKPEVFAEKILIAQSLDSYFSDIYGAPLDGTRSTKTEVLRYALHESQADPAFSTMIGDRSHDMIGAAENNLHSIGALYGFGSEEELREAGAQQLIHAPSDLLALF